ncbi:MAG: membrane protein insertase YidC [Candidatus Sedimenticola sp. (ex Thyasira tokunagai)]
MDNNLRLIMFFGLAFIVLMIWENWNVFLQEKQGLTGETAAVVETTQVPPVPTATVNSTVPAVGSEVPAAIPQPTSSVSIATAAQSIDSQKIVAKSDLYTMEIDTLGGNILKVFLNEYPETLGDTENKFQLLSPAGPDLFIARSGLIGGEGVSAPNHESPYQAEKSSYQMGSGDESLQFDLNWSGDDGVKVTKRFIFTRGSYLVTVQHIVENGSGSAWTGREYRELVRTEPEDDGNSQFVYTYTGGAIYSEAEKYETISFSDMKDKALSREVKGGWIAMLQHYFLGAWVPPVDETDHFYTNVFSGSRYVLGAYTPGINVADGSSHTFSSGFVAGPKLQDKLEVISKGLDLSVNYGWLTVLAQPIFWLLKAIQGVVGNWGWSIILLTLLIKLAFFKLTETSYRSMANMRKMTPRIQALKDRYGDDKQRMNTAMMEMYKKEKINPLGGCLPIVVQIPVFIALYWVLLESVELRQAPFIFWIEDMSTKDPYFVLPVIMGISMFIQQKLNPAPPDPMQAKIMMSLPFVFTFFFAFFPSGLVLYWVTNNVLSIAQQWHITRQIEAT